MYKNIGCLDLMKAQLDSLDKQNVVMKKSSYYKLKL